MKEPGNIIDLSDPAIAEKTVHVHIGRQLNHFRLSYGLSQEDMARELHVTFQQYQKYEHAINRLSPGKLYILARALQVPVSMLFPQETTVEYAPPPCLQITRLTSRVAQHHPDEMAIIARALVKICEKTNTGE